MLFGGSIRFSTADFRSGEYPTSSSYPARLKSRGKVERRTTTLTQGDADGKPIDPGPEAIDALLDVWPIFEAFQLTYVSKGLLLEQEKNASALSPNGPSAGASDTAKPVRKPARTARRG
jgi:hypothetical protein